MEIAWGAPLEGAWIACGGSKTGRAWGARLKEQSCWHGFFKTNSVSAIVPKKMVPRTSQTVSKRWTKGHAGHAWEKVLCWRAFHFVRRSVRRCLVFAPFAVKQTKR